ncbi:MAG: BglG family transcription antiterminator [Lachnospiraceae bacterium]
MISMNLSLRQRKLLHYMQNKNTFVTSQELAGHLNVSSRTIRNDITEINHELAPLSIRIKSKSSLGYWLDSENEKNLSKLNQSSNSFLTRDDRIRHIAFRLCLSDDPINLYDLEDEMYVSHTTLEHDIDAMKQKYLLPFAGTDLVRSKNCIQIYSVERQKRAILNRLFAENWNYNARGNAYYQYQFLEEAIINQIMTETNYHLKRYGIVLEDINMVMLNLSIAIMYYRVMQGHTLTVESFDQQTDLTALHASNDLLDSVQELLQCSFSEIERYEIYLHISCSKTMDSGNLNSVTVGTFFEADVVDFADRYIGLVHTIFHIDLSENEDFYHILLQFLRYITLPVHNFNEVQTHSDIIRTNLLISFEISYIIQPLALEFYGSYLTYHELLYLAFSIEGALKAIHDTTKKLNTVILCHLNLYSTWFLKQALLDKFQHSLELKALLPVYMKDNYDFSKIDLVITTANKEISSLPNFETVVISPFFTEQDQKDIETYIYKRQLSKLYRSSYPSIQELLSTAKWHESLDACDYHTVIETLFESLVAEGLVLDQFAESILAREEILTFAFRPSIVFVYSLLPSTKTQLLAATLDHRIKWNSYKIRTVIMAALHPDDTSLVFKFIHDLFYSDYNLNEMRFYKTKAEILNFLKNE